MPAERELAEVVVCRDGLALRCELESWMPLPWEDLCRVDRFDDGIAILWHCCPWSGKRDEVLHGGTIGDPTLADRIERARKQWSLARVGGGVAGAGSGNHASRRPRSSRWLTDAGAMWAVLEAAADETCDRKPPCFCGSCQARSLITQMEAA